MTTPLQITWSFMVNEIAAMVTWLSRLRLYNVPITGYFIGLLVLGLLIDYIF